MYKEQCMVVPPALRRDLILTANTTAHVGLKLTLEELQKYFHWPGIEQDLETALTDCVGCLHKRTSN